jgi:hypothetical protein
MGDDRSLKETHNEVLKLEAAKAAAGHDPGNEK